MTTRTDTQLASTSHVGRLNHIGALDLLTAWELGASLDPVDRPTAALALAMPGYTVAELGQLSLGQRDRLLLNLFGADSSAVIEGMFSCPSCSEPMEVSFNCALLADSEPPREPEPYQQDGWLIQWRLPNGNDLSAASGCPDQQQAADLLLARCMLDVRGPDGLQSADALPTEVRSAFIDYVESWDGLTDICLDAECAACHTRHDVDLDIAAMAWHGIEVAASAAMREVALLARAYGWSEAETLTLPPGRRRAYLELAHG